jgi:hypothetical protein
MANEFVFQFHTLMHGIYGKGQCKFDLVRRFRNS